MANFLYDGVELLDINTVWTDEVKTQYPYAAVCVYPSLDGNAGKLLLSDSPFVYTDNIYKTSSGNAVLYYEYDPNGAQGTVYPVWTRTLKGVTGNSGVDWTSSDVLADDGSLQLKATPAIIVDGKLTIKRGGDSVTTLLSESVAVSYNSDVGVYVSAPLTGLDGLSVGDEVWVVMNGVSYPDTVSTITNFGGIPGFGSVALTFADRPYLFAKTNLGAGEQWYLAVTSSATREVDIFMGGGVVTDTTADITFTCTDLENTEQTDSIKAWVYKKSDDVDTTITPTWTSEMFGAPSYSASHTFSGLEPNTEYEVYGCIFVNGEATDQNAVATFTTLEASGDLKPVYKRVNGAWVKQTAYERVNGEWVLISTKESTPSANGDGYALYNGVKLPNIDTIWDKATYPYAAIIAEPSIPNVYSLVLTSVAVDPSSNVFSGLAFNSSVNKFGIIGPCNYYLNIGTVNGWFDNGSADYVPSGSVHDLDEAYVLWSNFNIYDGVDGSVYLASSDPIPLDGYTVIEWDGNTEGLDKFTYSLDFYNVSPVVLSKEQLVGTVYAFNGVIGENNVNFGYMFTATDTIADMDNGYGIFNFGVGAVVGVVDQATSELSAGIYLPNSSGQVGTHIIAYKA